MQCMPDMFNAKCKDVGAGEDTTLQDQIDWNLLKEGIKSHQNWRACMKKNDESHGTSRGIQWS